MLCTYIIMKAHKEQNKLKTLLKKENMNMAKATKTKVTNNVGTSLNTDGVIKAMAEASKNTDTVISQKQAGEALALLKGVVGDALATGQKVQLTGFISFNPSYRAPRKGNNVITNEPMDIPGGVVVSVKAGKALKDVMKGLDDSIVKAVQEQK